MAESKNNILVHGFSGKLGNLLVFRQKGDKTIIATAPRKYSGQPSESQLKNRERFQEAVVYAQRAIADPDAKAAYKEKAQSGQTAYNLAFADFFKAPDISEINISNYNGKKGDTIIITVADDFVVKKVTVTILNADGTEVESGEAQSFLAGRQWLYTAQADNASLEGDKIIIKAYDVPGNVTEEEKVLAP